MIECGRGHCLCHGATAYIFLIASNSRVSSNLLSRPSCIGGKLWQISLCSTLVMFPGILAWGLLSYFWKVLALDLRKSPLPIQDKLGLVANWVKVRCRLCNRSEFYHRSHNWTGSNLRGDIAVMFCHLPWTTAWRLWWEAVWMGKSYIHSEKEDCNLFGWTKPYFVDVLYGLFLIIETWLPLWEKKNSWATLHLFGGEKPKWKWMMFISSEKLFSSSYQVLRHDTLIL